MKAKITIEALESGYVVTRRDWNAGQYWSHNKHRTAEATLTGALSLAARALGYHGTIEFGPRTVEVPVVDSVDAYAPPGVAFDAEEPPLRAGTATKPDDLL